MKDKSFIESIKVDRTYTRRDWNIILLDKRDVLENDVIRRGKGITEYYNKLILVVVSHTPSDISFVEF